MKRISLIIAMFFLVNFSFSQSPVLRNSLLDPEEEQIGITWYDLQSNASSQNRIYRYDDGTIGAVWTIGTDYPNYPDRGTGYNYFDGTSWQPGPEARIESQRTGWPSYTPLGENGELIVAHLSWVNNFGLLFSKRINKGSGDWTESLFQGPPGQEALLWPRMVTGGLNHNLIYLIALTTPVANGGSVYQGLDGALIYSRSTDGGETWDIQNQILPGMDSSDYTGFSPDCYAFAEPGGIHIAFVVGSYRSDLFLMKSDDGGQTFQKTIIWDNPYDLVTPSFQTDTFYSCDGSVAVALDMNGMAHVAFGIVRTYFDTQNNNWKFYKLTDGVGYWDETMNTFSSNINALDPTGGPESELVPDESLIGWAQDLDGDSTVTYLNQSYTPTTCFYNSLGVSSMVQLIADDLNRLFLVYSSITETFDNGNTNYRHLWVRASQNNGQSWDPFYHYYLPDQLYDEFAFPSCAANSDDFIYLSYLSDNEPGLDCPGEPQYSQNFIKFVKIPKDEIVGINQPKKEIPEFTVSQNYPNPFHGTCEIKINLRKPTAVKLEVINLTGQTVFERAIANAAKGLITLKIDAVNLDPGIYFYTVKSADSFVTKKMVVR